MAPTQQGESDRRLPPLGLRGLSRVAFQPRAPPPGGLPPLGLIGRAGVASFSIGTAGFDHLPPPTTLPRRRVGLARPSRPPAPNEAGSSNWSASVGGTGTSSGGRAGTGSDGASSTFVGFTFGSGGISFGGGSRNSFVGGAGTGSGGGGNSFVGGAGTGSGGGGNSFVGGAGTGSGGGGFSFSTSREANLDVMSNKETRRQYDTDDKRHIYAEIIKRNGTGRRLKHGVSKAVALACDCPRRIVQRVWLEAKKGGGITGVKNNRKLKSGRKKINFDIDALEAIPPGERTTLEQVAGHLNLSTTTIWRR
ncbi:hypothetical protein D1007_06738 [Hordeum vulgare]|nr:hypothetical protein D1007_06738 [Hordeum vulgare]